ncbi:MULTISPECIES: hypothetical protein [Rhodomicrobium]|uniref:hypothetical protein n=1 Tax=Rhodomicrobium TaxID=1068 RepID=UPI000B4A87F5|nr:MULTISPECIES: hypothetical protein [Rhodomicrobium]
MLIAEGGGGRTTPVYDERREIIELKREINRNRQLQAAKQSQAGKTEGQRQATSAAVGKYQEKVDAHQKNWLKANGHKYHTQAALQQAWENAWAVDGKAARDELEPYLVDYDRDIREDLRLAADGADAAGGDPKAAVEARASELKSADGSDGLTDQFLDGIVTRAAIEVGHETPAMRAAARQYEAAGAEWGAAQQIPEGDRTMNTFLQQRYESAKANFEDARTNFIKIYSDAITTDLEAGLASGKSLDQVTSEVKSLYDEGLSDLVDFRVIVLNKTELVDEWQTAIESDIGALGLTPAELELGAKDSNKLAFLKAAGFTLELDPVKYKAMTGFDLSKEEIELAKKDPIFFFFLQKQNIHFSMSGNSVVLKIGAKNAPAQMQLAAQQGFDDGGVLGLAGALSAPVFADSDLTALMEGADKTRTKFGKANLYRHEGKDRLQFVNMLLTGYFTLGERKVFWDETGRGAVEPILRDGLNGVKVPEDDLDERRFLTYIGEYMDEALVDGSPEMAALVIDLVMDRVDSASPEMEFGSTEVFAQSMVNAVHLADQLPGSVKAEEVARWMVASERGLINRDAIGEFRNAIANTGNTELGDAVLSELRATDEYSSGFPEEFKWGVDDGKKAANIAFGEAKRAAEFTAFMDPAQQKTILNGFFDRFADMPDVGKPLSTANSPELRNTLGQIAGYHPDQNLDAYARGDKSVDWFSEDSTQRAVIDLLVTWVDIEDGDGQGATATIYPYAYGSKRDGVDYSLLIKITRADGSESFIDGNAADDVVNYFLGDPMTKDDDKEIKQEDVPLQWHYTGFDDFIDHNNYDTGGTIYLPKDWKISKADGHVEWMEMAAARETGKETFMKWADGVATALVFGASLVLAPFTAGGSLALGLTCLGVLAAGTGWTVYSAHDRRDEMGEHGASTKFSNPAARDTYIQEATAIFSILPMGAGWRAVRLARIGKDFEVVGALTRNTAMAARGARTLDASAKYAQWARALGRPNTAIGIYFTVDQSISLIQNFDKMNNGERWLALYYAAFGVSQFAIGKAAERIPRFQEALSGNPRFSKQQEEYFEALGHARLAGDAGEPLDSYFGSYFALENGDILFTPTVGKPIMIYAAERIAPKLVLPSETAAAPSSPILTAAQGRPPAHSGGRLIVPGEGESTSGDFYMPDGVRTNITDAVSELGARGTISESTLATVPVDAVDAFTGRDGDEGPAPSLIIADRRGGNRGFLSWDGPPALARTGKPDMSAEIGMQDPADAPVVIRMTSSRQASLQTGRDARTDQFIAASGATVRSEFAQWLRPQAPGTVSGRLAEWLGWGRSTSEPTIVRQDDTEFETTFASHSTDDASHVQGFYLSGSNTIHLRNRPSGFFEPFNGYVVGHEYLHSLAARYFTERVGSLKYRPTDKFLDEGVTQYLTFKAFGPKEYAQQEMGYAKYVLSLDDRGQLTKDNGQYLHETLLAEEIFERMAADGYDPFAAYFQGEVGAVEAFYSYAMADPNVVPATKPNAGVHSAKWQPSGNIPGGKQVYRIGPDGKMALVPAAQTAQPAPPPGSVPPPPAVPVPTLRPAVPGTATPVSAAAGTSTSVPTVRSATLPPTIITPGRAATSATGKKLPPLVIISDVPSNPYRGKPIRKGPFRRVFTFVAESRATRIDAFARDLGVDPSVVESDIVQDIVNGIPILGRLADLVADIHAHSRTYDRRWDVINLVPPGKSDRPMMLVNKTGWGSRILIGDIPQDCGIGHYSNVASRLLSLKLAGLLDRKNVKSWDRANHTFKRWTQTLETVAKDINPEIAIALDRATLMGGTVKYRGKAYNLTQLINQLHLEAPAMHRTLSNQVRRLAKKQPHAVLRYDLSITGFNPGGPKGAKQVRQRLMSAPGRRAFIGEVTLHKEMVDAMLGKEGTTFRDMASIKNFREVMKLADESGLGVLIHCDWGNVSHRKSDGRPQAGTHEYENFDQLIELVSQYPNANIVLAHTGIGRYVRPDSTAISATEMIGPDGHKVAAGNLVPSAFAAKNGVRYGTTVPMHILKMEQALAKAPHVKFDISWNDVGEAFVTDPALFEGLIRFIQRHPDAVTFGSDTVKPVNKGQYRQAFNTLLPLLGELAQRPGGRELVWKVMRGNYVDTINSAFYGTDPSGKKVKNGVIDWTAARAGVDDRKKMEAMHARLNDGMSVNGEKIVLGRKDLEAMARREFDVIISDYLASGASMRRGPKPPGSALVGNADFSVLDSRALGRRPINLVPADASSEYPRQTGTGQGSPTIQFPGSRFAPVASRLTRGAVILGAAVAGGIYAPGMAGPAAAVARQLLFLVNIRYRDFVRLSWDQMFEEGQITNKRLDAFVTRVLKVGNTLGIDKEALRNVVVETLQFRKDISYILDSSNGRALSHTQQFDAIMATVGLYQIRVDRALGVQAASLEATLPQTKLGRFVNNRIVDTATLSLLTTLYSSTADLIHRPGDMGPTATKAALDIIALSAMITVRLKMNKGGLTNSDLVDNAPYLRWFNAGSYAAIGGSGGVGVWQSIADSFAQTPDHSVPVNVTTGVLNAIVAYYGLKTAGIEGARQFRLGGPDSGKIFGAGTALVVSLALAAAANVIADVVDD